MPDEVTKTEEAKEISAESPVISEIPLEPTGLQTNPASNGTGPIEPTTIETNPAPVEVTSEPAIKEQEPIIPENKPVTLEEKQATPEDGQATLEPREIPLEPTGLQASPASNGTGPKNTTTEPVPAEAPKEPGIKPEIKPEPAPSVTVPPAIITPPSATEKIANSFLANMKRARELLVSARNKIQINKRKKLDKIMTLFEKKNKITSRDVRELLHVSKNTADDYINILEKENKIILSGKKGNAPTYAKK